EDHQAEDEDLRAEQRRVRQIAPLEGSERRQERLRRPMLDRLPGDAQREQERQQPEQEGAQGFFSWSPNLASTCSRNSVDARTTGGNSPSISNGRQASMMAREFHVTPLGSRGSSGPLQARLMKSMSCTGSQRVHIAHSTCSRLVGSMSSSTTTTKRPRYEPDWQAAARCSACRAWPAYACLIEMTLNMRAQPGSCTQTPWTPGNPAR